jgi:Pyruvate/2-oxoacid:ferredoxin oxidoreductase delta subunit
MIQMCEFCHKHGEGKKWYLEAKNYSEDLMGDLEHRRRYLVEFFSRPERLAKGVRALEALDRAPALTRKAIRRAVVRRQKKHHYGQVLPIEDVERILGFTTSITRLACICRQATVRSEQRYCYGVSLLPNDENILRFIREADIAYLTGPEVKGLESLGREEALQAMRDHEAEGLCHTVWTFETPFIGGICNCDQSDCLAMRASFRGGTPLFFRAEYVAEVNPDDCNGCRQCLRLCPFGAIFYSAAKRKVEVDKRLCYGCGICRSACRPQAISLLDRASVPAAAGLW